MNILDKLKINHRPSAGALDLLKYIGPGLLVTVGFIGVGRSHCSADAVRNANQSRRSHRDGCLPRNVTYQYVQQNRTLDYHVRLNHRTFVSL